MPQDTTTLNDYTLANANFVYSPSEFDRVAMQVRSGFVFNESMIPAIVKSYNPATNEITVEVAIKAISARRDENGNYETLDRGKVITTAWRPRFGGLTMYFPYKEGDTGWLEASDRDTQSFKDSDMTKTIEPATFSLSKYRFGKFIPDRMSSGNVSQEDSGNIVISSEDSTTKITISPDGKIGIKGNVTIDGNVNCTETITAKEFIGNGIKYTPHVHDSPHGRTSGPYNP